MPPSISIEFDSYRSSDAHEIASLLLKFGDVQLARCHIEVRKSNFNAGNGCEAYRRSGGSLLLGVWYDSEDEKSSWSSIAVDSDVEANTASLDYRFEVAEPCMLRLLFEMESDGDDGLNTRLFPLNRFVARKNGLGAKFFVFEEMRMLAETDFATRRSICRFDRNVEAGEHRLSFAMLVDSIDRFHLWHLKEEENAYAFENPEKEIVKRYQRSAERSDTQGA